MASHAGGFLFGGICIARMALFQRNRKDG
jgi:hypothetical protein